MTNFVTIYYNIKIQILYKNNYIFTKTYMALNFHQLLREEKRRKQKEGNQVEANTSSNVNENSLQLFTDHHVDEQTDNENLVLTSWTEK